MDLETKTRPCVVAALLALFAVGCRTTPISRGTDELLRAEREFNAAFTLKDTATLERLMAPDYSFQYIDTTMGGTLQATPNAPRGRWAAEMLKHVSNGPLRWSIVDSRIIGGNTGVVVAHYKWIGTWDSRTFQYEGYITDVWVRQGGKWKIVMSSANAMAPPF
jgi:ketosteroid isomerase-like protein